MCVRVMVAWVGGTRLKGNARSGNRWEAVAKAGVGLVRGQVAARQGCGGAPPPTVHVVHGKHAAQLVVAAGGGAEGREQALWQERAGGAASSSASIGGHPMGFHWSRRRTPRPAAAADGLPARRQKLPSQTPLAQGCAQPNPAAQALTRNSLKLIESYM